MRRGFALIWLGATAVVSTIVGVISYQAGWAAGAARLPEAAAAVPPPAYFYGPHFFGFFGFLPFLFLLFVLFLVIRAGRGWGPRYWAMGPGGWGGYQQPPPQVTPQPQPAPQPQQPAGEPWQEWPQRPARENPPAPPPPE